MTSAAPEHLGIPYIIMRPANSGNIPEQIDLKSGTFRIKEIDIQTAIKVIKLAYSADKSMSDKSWHNHENYQEWPELSTAVRCFSSNKTTPFNIGTIQCIDKLNTIGLNIMVCSPTTFSLLYKSMLVWSLKTSQNNIYIYIFLIWTHFSSLKLPLKLSYSMSLSSS